MLSSESANEDADIEYFVKAIEAIYSVRVGKNKVKRIVEQIISNFMFLHIL